MSETQSETDTERTLILLRHAKSDWSGGEADADRPLSDRGLRQAPIAGRWLAGWSEHIDLAVISPAVRARETWQLAATELGPAASGSRPPVHIEDRVYAASADELLDVVRALPDDAVTVVLVGHNPGMEELVAQLTGDRLTLPTSAIAVIGWSGPWASAADTEAVLRTSGRPPGADAGDPSSGQATSAR
ncbi:SixA phosphatase family protein [Glaciibacter sp. 2TAF33]|uniref:SixA phosphatase family protein n=1 Tax=Glaciibacter sp. 2TAF33 TaxID=3233015 RepID=UPI003F914151